MNPQPESDITVNRKTLRQLLVKSFSQEEILDFCFDYFPDVYEQLHETNIGKHITARLLIDYCERRGLIRHLLQLLKEHNTYQYTLHQNRLFRPNKLPASSEEQAQVTLKLTFPKLYLKDFTIEKQAVLVQLIAEELDIPVEEITIVDIRQGSVIVALRLPSQAARRLITLFYAGSPFIQDLGVAAVTRMPKLSLWQRILRFLARLGSNPNLFILIIMIGTLLIGLATLPSTISQGQNLGNLPETSPQIVAVEPPHQTQVPSPTATSLKRATPQPTRTRLPTTTPVISSGRNLVVVTGPAEVEVGQLFEVVVCIKDIISPGVFGAQFKLNYQPDYLEIVDRAAHSELLVVQNSIDYKQGTLLFAASRHTNVPNFSQAVDFVTITFKAKSATTGQTALVLTDLKVGAKGGVSVPAVVENLTLVVE